MNMMKKMFNYGILPVIVQYIGIYIIYAGVKRIFGVRNILIIYSLESRTVANVNIKWQCDNNDPRTFYSRLVYKRSIGKYTQRTESTRVQT